MEINETSGKVFNIWKINVISFSIVSIFNGMSFGIQFSGIMEARPVLLKNNAV